MGAGGNGKSIVGDAWWLDTESEPFTGRAPSSAAGKLCLACVLHQCMLHLRRIWQSRTCLPLRSSCRT